MPAGWWLWLHLPHWCGCCTRTCMWCQFNLRRPRSMCCRGTDLRKRPCRRRVRSNSVDQSDIPDIREQCDCGQEDCSEIDPCCDGNICQLASGAQCSSSEPCCSDTCSFLTAGTLCRAQTQTCDEPDTCSGQTKAELDDGVMSFAQPQYRDIRGLHRHCCRGRNGMPRRC